ncbi:MAG: iron-sulfur cluster carrier protein ApbC [Alphaproteobacteria bacterium]|nr:iron-sulfur cluster carrier protein ApbC [Alphaproteobacteria bacterium]
MSLELHRQVLESLASITDPLSGRDVVKAGLITGLAVHDGHVSFALEIPHDAAPRMEKVRAACAEAARKVPGVKQVTAVLTAHRPSPQQGSRAALSREAATEGAPRPGPAPAGIPGVRSIIAVASGKGGVGKSTLAVNLALGLVAQGLSVGLLDADIYGPSVPHLLGISQKPHSDGKKLHPIERYGLKAMSIGFLVDIDTPMIWRGPMVMSALTQLMNDVAWGELDVMVIDMPPGTGDAQLTIAQRVPLAGAVIVSTPQDIALIDARKGLAMFRKTQVPILGIIENMSRYICPECGHEAHIFGHGGARETAAMLDCDMLGEVPLHLSIRETSDAGRPVMVSMPESREAEAFRAIARKVADKLAAGSQAKPAPAIRFV